MEVDGTDFIESFKTARKAAEYLRSGAGPVLIHAHVTRPLSHSSADTQAYYRLSEDLAAEALRDPLVRMKSLLAENGVDEEKLKALELADHLADTQGIRGSSSRTQARPRYDQVARHLDTI